jgi:Sulfotransferase family
VTRPATTVVYIAGSGRSGSTLLDTVLGSIDGWFSVGELRFLWERSLVEDRVCGCGRPFSACPVWTKIMAAAFGRPPSVDPGEVMALRDAAMPLRATPLALVPGGRRLLRRRYAAYLDVLARLYRAVAEVTGARVVVDSSKYPSYGYLLGLVPGLDVRVVHLVRDARAVAHSWTRVKLETRAAGDVRPMAQVRPARAALDWTAWALLAETFGRAGGRGQSLTIRYEDLVAAPRPVLERVLSHATRAADPLPLVGGSRVALVPNHTVGGNPSRFRTGVVDLRADQEWTSAMRRRDRAAVTALSWPALHRYGYPVRSVRACRSSA